MYLTSSYELEKIAATIMQERQAEADASRLAREPKAHHEQALRWRLARLLTIVALPLDRQSARARRETDVRARSFAASTM